MPQALAIANNDLVYLWWTYESKIPDCLGFAIYRLGPGGKRETVGEAGARRVDVDRGRVGRTDRLLNQRGGRGHQLVRGAGRHHDEVDLSRIEVRNGERLKGGLGGQRSRRLTGAGHTPLDDARPLADPLV